MGAPDIKDHGRGGREEPPNDCVLREDCVEDSVSFFGSSHVWLSFLGKACWRAVYVSLLTCQSSRNGNAQASTGEPVLWMMRTASWPSGHSSSLRG